MSSASDSAASGFIWGAISQVVKVGSQIASLLILARLLPAADFGVIAMASAVTGFALLFRDFGAMAALIQRPALTPNLLDSVFWFNVIVGMCIAAGLALLSPIVAWFFSESRLREVLWLLALAFPLGALGLVQQGLLERASNFRSVALVESSAVLLGVGSAVWAAVSGWGVYSLVLQTLVTSIVMTTGFWIFSPWRPGRNGSIAELKNLWDFSGNLLGFNVFNYFTRNADNMLIGKCLGASELGYYSMAYRLMLWPLQNISGVLGRALFPVLSRMQADPARLAAAYVRAISAITLITAPLMLGFFVLREPFVATVLGIQWMPVSKLLAWFAPLGLLQSLGATVGTLYLATGKTDLMLRWGIFSSTVCLVSFGVGIQWGLEGLVVAYTLATTLLFLPSLIIPFRLVGLKVSKVLLNLFPSLMVAVAMALILFLTDRLWKTELNLPIFRLTVLVMLGIVIYGALSYFFQKEHLKDIVRKLWSGNKT